MAEAKDEPEGVGLNVEANEDKNKSHGMCYSLKSFLCVHCECSLNM